MRLLSRFLSVFLALILLGASLLTVSAHAPDTTTGNDSTNKGSTYATIAVELTSDKGTAEAPANINNTLDFTISVYRLTSTHRIVSATLAGPNTADNVTEDDATVEELNDTNSYREVKLKYTVQASDLGSASERTATLTWTLNFTARSAEGNSETNDHTVQSVTGTVQVVVAKRGDGEVGASELSLDFGDEPVIEVKKGAELKLTADIVTGKYGFDGKTLLITKQYYDEDGDKDGVALPAVSVVIPDLGDNARIDGQKTSPETYKLSQRDIDVLDDGGMIKFAYELVVNEADLYKSGTSGVRVDVNGDGDIGTETQGDTNPDNDTPVLVGATDDAIDGIDVQDLVEKLSGTLLTLPYAPTVEPTATPDYIGMTAAATVREGNGNRIDIELADGTEFSLTLGRLFLDGTAHFNANGYIREEVGSDGRGGQTYGVVRRDSDNMVVRVWIASGTQAALEVPWAIVNSSHTYASGVVAAIKLDETFPTEDQLVRNNANGMIYVYRSGAWRHVPDTATFKHNSFYWCDVATADSGFFDRFTAGPALVPSGTYDDPNYPACHNM